MIAFNLACYASVTGRMEEAKERLRVPSSSIRRFGNWHLTMKTEALVGLDCWLGVNLTETPLTVTSARKNPGESSLSAQSFEGETFQTTKILSRLT